MGICDAHIIAGYDCARDSFLCIFRAHAVVYLSVGSCALARSCHAVALSVGAVSLSVLLFGVYEAHEPGPLVSLPRARSTCHVFHTGYGVALSVLLFGVYEALESGPLVSLLI